MNCKKCGSPLNPDSEFCPECGAPIEETIPTDTVEEAVPISEMNSGNNDSTFVADYAEPKKPSTSGMSKKMKMLLIAVISVVVLAAGAFAAYFIFSPAEEPKAPSGKTETFANDVSQAVSMFKSSENILDSTLSLDLKVTLGKEGKELLFDALRASGNDQVISILESIDSAELRTDVTLTRDKVALDASLSANESSLINGANFIIDANTGRGYLTVPELNDSTLCVDLQLNKREFDAFISSIEESQKIANIIPDENKIKDFVVKFTNLICESLGEIAEEKNTIEINGVSKEYSYYSVEITEDMALNAAEKVLTEIKSDETAKEVITAIGDYTHESDLYSEFIKEVDNALADLKEEKGSTSSDTLTLKLWFDENNEITGINLADNGDKIELDCRTVSANGKVESVLSIKERGREEFGFTYSGTVSGDKHSGSTILKIEGQEAVELGFKDVDAKQLEEGNFIGEISLKPAPAIAKNIPAQFRDIKLVLSSNSEDAFKLALYNGDAFYASVDLSIKIEKAKEITVPSNYYEPHRAEEWAQNMNILKIIGNLSSAGIKVPTNF